MSTTRAKHTFRLPTELAEQLAEAARTRRTSQTAIIEAALGAYLSAEAGGRNEAVIGRRLDRLSRALDRLEWNTDLGNETLALFIRSWLINTAPLPDTEKTAAKAMGRARWVEFVELLTRRMESGQRLRSGLPDAPQ